jgi:hypothetical protein
LKIFKNLVFNWLSNKEGMGYTTVSLYTLNDLEFYCITFFLVSLLSSTSAIRLKKNKKKLPSVFSRNKTVNRSHFIVSSTVESAIAFYQFLCKPRQSLPFSNKFKNFEKFWIWNILLTIFYVESKRFPPTH